MREKKLHTLRISLKREILAWKRDTQSRNKVVQTNKETYTLSVIHNCGRMINSWEAWERLMVKCRVVPQFVGMCVIF